MSLIPVTGVPVNERWDPVEESADLMTREEFLSIVKCGGFIDYDGYGHLSDGFYESGVSISPSQVNKINWPAWATHVVWFNR